MFKISRYWNKLAFFIMIIGYKMIWDYTGKNGYLIPDIEEFKLAKDILSDTK